MQEFSLENTELATSKESASCWSFSSIVKELLELSSHLEAPLWTRNTTKFW
jgi:hypothetical protein